MSISTAGEGPLRSQKRFTGFFDVRQEPIAGKYGQQLFPDRSLGTCWLCSNLGECSITWEKITALRVPMNRKMRRTAQARGKQRHPSSPRADHDYVSAFLDSGWQLLNEGRDQEATELAKRLIRRRETDGTKAFFIKCVGRWTYFPGAEEVHDLLARAILESWARLPDLIGIVLGLLTHDPLIGGAMRRASETWPRRLSLPELFGPEGTATIANDSLLLALLEAGKVIDINLERVLTSVRASLLGIVLRDEGRHYGGLLDLGCALASQCFLNEYVFDEATEETTGVGQLCAHICAATASGDGISPLMLAVIAAYRRLDSLPEAEALLKRRWPKKVSVLLDQQICKPAVERSIRGQIQQITTIQNATSISVQAQYEESPYPRWLNATPDGFPLTLDEYCRMEFPNSQYRSAGKEDELDMLIAGCGTGHHSVRFAQSFPRARILAVDLSLASLAYAKRKSDELGLKNIEYAQADILELNQLPRSFDVISSAGVLHHLADPQQGWRTLLSLLRSDGCMHVGLYSEVARRDVIIAQAWLRAHGFGDSIEDIRRARQELTSAAEGLPVMTNVLKFWDFYTTSECRDLLFPRQERRFTIPLIKEFLAENNLWFLGFNLNIHLKANFMKRFSFERFSDLSAWDQFEAEKPDTFGGMYEFWIQMAA